MSQKITPFLWFEKDAKKIAEFYCTIFKDGVIRSSSVISDTPSGTIEVVQLSLLGQHLTLMSAGPQFKLSEAFSLMVEVETQEEVDYYWERLTADGGQESMCGWLKDKYGLSWQITPKRLNELTSDPDKEKAGRAMQAMLSMKKIVIADLEKAVNG